MRNLEFVLNDLVYLKISPLNDAMRFCKKGKCSPRYVEQYDIIRRIIMVAYELEFPTNLVFVCLVFHIPLLKKHIGYLIYSLRIFLCLGESLL